MRKSFAIIIALSISILIASHTLFANALIPYRKGDLWGFSNEKSEIVIQPQYEYVDFFSDGLAIVGKNQRFGFINEQGKEVIAMKYETASDFKLGVATVMINGKYAVIDKTGKLLTKFKYLQYAFENEVLKVRTEDGWGIFFPSKSKEIIQNSFENIGTFKNEKDFVWVQKENKVGLVSLINGKEILAPKFDKIYPFDNGFAVVKNDSLFGVIDKTGKEILAPEYAYVPTGFSFKRPLQKEGKWFFMNSEGTIISDYFDAAKVMYNGLAEVFLNNKYGFVNEEGKVVIPIEYDAVGKPEEGFIAVKKGNTWGFIDYANQEKIEFKFEDFPDSKYQMHFAEGLCKVKKNGNFGFINTLSNVKIPIIYSEATPFFDEYSLVKRGGNEGIIDIKGEEIIPAKYTKIHYFGLNRYFDNGIAIASKGDKWGFINNKGEELTEFVFDAPELQNNLENDFNILPYKFFEGLCRVSVNGKIGFINLKGENVIVPQFKEAQDFQRGLATVKLKDRWGFINRSGDLVSPYKYSDFYIYEDVSESNVFFRAVEFKNLWGLVGNNGKELIPCKFDNPLTWANTFKNGLMWVFFNGKDGYVNSKGTAFFED